MKPLAVKNLPICACNYEFKIRVAGGFRRQDKKKI